jgi:cytochrome c oxidase subunit 2
VGLGIGLAHEKSPSLRQSVNIATWFPVILLLTACTGPYSALEPEGPSAQGAATLWWIMAVGAGVIFAIMCTVLALALLKPRPVRAFGPRRMLLWGGLVVPSIILTALVIAAFALGERLLATPREDMPLRIEAIARQWQWEFRYPDGSSTLDLVHMPTGQDVDFAVTTEDVIHSFWIPRLGGKIDAIPGHTNVIRLRADRPGTYGGVCAEFCGVGHGSMYFRVQAHDQATYQALTLRADEGAQQ